MPSVLAPGRLTDFGTSLNGPLPGGADVGGWGRRDVKKFVESQFPLVETPITKSIGGEETSAQEVYENGVHGHLLVELHLATSVITTDTDWVVQSGEAKNVQVGQYGYVFNLDSNGKAKWSTREMVQFTAANTATDHLTVVRALGQTTAKNFTGGSATTGALIVLGAPAVIQGADFTKSPTVLGDMTKNGWQLIALGHDVTEDFENNSDQEYDAHKIARMMKDAAQYAALYLERAYAIGSYDRGTNASGAQKSQSFAGILEMIPSANVTDMGGNPLGPFDIETVGSTLWKSVGSSGAKSLLMSMDTARMFDGILNKYRQANMKDDSINLVFNSFETRFGVFTITPSRWFPDGVVAGVDWTKLTKMTYQGMDWKEKEHSTDGAYIWRSIYAKKGLRMDSPEIFWMAHNFDTNITNYRGLI